MHDVLMYTLGPRHRFPYIRNQSPRDGFPDHREALHILRIMNQRSYAQNAGMRYDLQKVPA